MSFYKHDNRNKTPIMKYLSNNIEVLMEFSYDHDDFRPSKLIISKYNNDKIPPTELILKEIRDKLGFSINYSENFESKVNTWETKIISSLKSKSKK